MNKKLVFLLFAVILIMVCINFTITKYLATQKLNFTQTTASVFRQTSSTQTIDAESPKIAVAKSTQAEEKRFKITTVTEVSAKTQTESSSSAGKTCPKGTILYTPDAGNTGNKIWEYLSVLAVYKLFPEKRFLPYIPDGMINHLEAFFEPLSLPKKSELPVECQNFTGAKIVLNSDNDIVIKNLPDGTKFVELAQDSSRYEDIIRYGFDKVREELRYKPSDVQIAMDTLRKIKNKFAIPDNENPVYVGMHFRGTDYTSYLKGLLTKNFKPPTHEYYSKAMKYFTEKYKLVIFILISIDRQWLKENAKHLNGYVAVNPNNNSKVIDMAILSHCNHSIISYGTFAATTAVLAGGTTIVYDLKIPVNYRGSTVALGIAKFLNTWVLMD